MRPGLQPLERDPQQIVFNQFCEFGNYLVHFNATGAAASGATRAAGPTSMASFTGRPRKEEKAFSTAVRLRSTMSGKRVPAAKRMRTSGEPSVTSVACFMAAPRDGLSASTSATAARQLQMMLRFRPRALELAARLRALRQHHQGARREQFRERGAGELGLGIGRPIEPVYPYRTSVDVQRPLALGVVVLAGLLVIAGGADFFLLH